MDSNTTKSLKPQSQIPAGAAGFNQWRATRSVSHGTLTVTQFTVNQLQSERDRTQDTGHRTHAVSEVRHSGDEATKCSGDETQRESSESKTAALTGGSDVQSADEGT